jgi:zinc protease
LQIQGLRHLTTASAAAGLCVLLLGISAPAAPAVWPLPPPLALDRFTLDNGMRVIVQTDPSAPVVALGLMVDVGARDETPGLSGLAHFFEHMMFQGSRRVAKMEHFTALEAVGADLNASTSTDRTWYYEVVPKPALKLALWLESDRFAALQIDPANVDNQRATVLEERKERNDNTPYAASQETLERLAFTSWALGHPVIGEPQDLERAPVEAFQRFWEQWYTPNNVICVLAGDITVDEAKSLLGKTLGRLPKRATIERPPLPVDLAPTAVYLPSATTRTHVLSVHEEKLGRTPALHLGWRVPAFPQDDALVLDLLAEVLAGSDASRLEKRLVREKPLATRYYATTHGRRDLDLFQIYIELADARPKALAEVRQRIRRELEDLALRGPTAAELDRAKVAFETGYVFASLGVGRRAELLATFELTTGDAHALGQVLPRYRSVSAADVQRVARDLLDWDLGVEVQALPQGFPTPQGAVVPRLAPPPPSPAALKEIAARDLATRRAAEHRQAQTPLGVPPAEMPRPTVPDLADATFPTPIVRQIAGVQLVVVERRQAPAVFVRWVLPGGKTREFSGKDGKLRWPEGTLELATDLALQGTRSHPGTRFAETLGAHGGAISLTPLADAVVVDGQVLSHQLTPYLGLLREVLTEPTLTAKDLASLKRRYRASLENDEADPATVADKLAQRLVFGVTTASVPHPYGSSGPTLDSLAAIGSAQVRAATLDALALGGSTLVIVGDVDAADLARQLQRVFGKALDRTAPLPAAPPAPVAEAAACHVVDVADAGQAALVIAWPAPPRQVQNRVDIGVANQVLGGSASSRLFQELREKRGLSYGIYSSWSGRRHAGEWSVTGSVRPDSAGEALAAIRAEVRRAREVAASPDEVLAARRYLGGQFAFALAAGDEVADRLAAIRLYDLPPDAWTRLPETLRAATPEGVQAATRDHLGQGPETAVIVGPISEMGADLNAACPKVVHHDTRGHVIPAPSRPAAPPVPKLPPRKNP